VKFLQGTKVLATRALVNGVASFVTTRLSAGPVALHSTYLGNIRTLGTTVPDAKLPAALTLNADVSETTAGFPVHLTAQIASTLPAQPDPSGSITFQDGATVLGTVPISLGGASLYTAFGTAGSHHVTATYSGDDSFGVAVSDPLTETVAAAVTSTFVSATKNPAHPGDAVTFNVDMMSSSLTPPPAGDIEFRDGGTLIGTAPITGSIGTVASFTTSSLTLGDHAITATYVGDVDHTPSTSSELHEVVSEPAVALGTGVEHTCALRSDGTIRCWGSNGSGELGDGSAVLHSSTPVSVSGISTATAISVGGYYSCALLAGGTVDCWGDNSLGELGDGTNDNSSTPVPVSGITGATAIASGRFHTCALIAGGAVRCWGDNEFGALGDGTTDGSSIPVAVSGLTGATAISSGDQHSCALFATGSVQCWGFNAHGALGNSGTDDSSIPVDVVDMTDATALSAGGYHTCAIVGGGAVRCWGNNGFGQLGDGSNVSSAIPVDVSNVTEAVGLSGGGQHTCAVIADGSIQCWGINEQGHLGRGTQTSSEPLPGSVTGITNAAAVSAGGVYTGALTTDATVDCWGYNSSGELGDGTTNTALTYVTVPGP
jgi:alpha-tubulin suppressor-like RCC1 family protein